MPPPPVQTKPVEDSVPKIDDAVAVGENLEFQRKWWRFEHAIWWFFAALILADVLGAFGRGWLAHAQRRSQDGSLEMKYERVERTMTPSNLSLVFGPDAVHDGHIRLRVSDSVVKDLGAQRISPQPSSSVLNQQGYLYTFPADPSGGTVQFALEPGFPGSYPVSIGLEGATPIQARILVMP